jgi:AcrR family transcriptional regulator
MIADHVGVTKAAVYHQFQSKDDIVVAVVEVELGQLEPALAAAEAHGTSHEAVLTLLVQVIDRDVRRRRIVGALLHDPVIARMLAEREQFRTFIARLNRVLLGGETSAEARVRAAMVATGIGGAVTHPLVADLDDDTLRAQLLDLTQRFLGLPD